MYEERVDLTDVLIEKIIGHRTRAVQEHASLRHTGEDRQLNLHVRSMKAEDFYAVAASALPRLWLLAAASLIGMTFVAEAPVGELIAPAIGSFLVFQGIQGSMAAVSAAATWACAWRAIRPILAAGLYRERVAREAALPSADLANPTVLAASSIAFAYGAKSVLRDVDLRIRRGERVLIEGSSGAGKSTFAKLVTGEKRPQGGVLLVGGLDPDTTSRERWRELVAGAPQFHENYIFTNTFAFNVDPRNGALGLDARARQLVGELGLDALLAKFPAGGLQLLGETGWQLSHGERSRVFIARALLQDARVVVFDESFGALDPITLSTVMECVRRRAATLLVIAHV